MALEELLQGLNGLGSVENLAQRPDPKKLAQQAYQALSYLGKDLSEYEDLETNPEKLDEVSQELPQLMRDKVVGETKDNMDQILVEYGQKHGLNGLIDLGFNYSEEVEKKEEYQQLRSGEQITKYFLVKDKEGNATDNIYNRYLLRSTDQQLREIVDFYSKVEEEKFENKFAVIENREDGEKIKKFDVKNIFTYIKDEVDVKEDEGYLQFADRVGQKESQRRNIENRQYEAQQQQEQSA
jgi:hypothetical protein